MFVKRALIAVFAGPLFFVSTVACASAGGVADRVMDRATRSAENVVSRRVAEGVGDAVECALDDAECAEQAERNGDATVFKDGNGEIIRDENGNPITDPEEARARMEEPGEGVWRNYDYVPGETVWFALDLEDEPVGRWPGSQLIYDEGTGQTVDRHGKKVLEFTGSTKFRVQLPDDLPSDFTIEVFYQAAAPLNGMWIGTEGTTTSISMLGKHYLDLNGTPGIYHRGGAVSSGRVNRVTQEQVSFKFQIDGDPGGEGSNTDYAILYAGHDRVAMVPNAAFSRGNQVSFHVGANPNYPAYLSDIVIAVHDEEPLYDALTTGERSFTTRGILFDFDSDRLTGASTKTLNDVLAMMNEHGDLSLVIEGHTDSSGEDAYNQELSERRAQAVVAWLTSRGVDSGRLMAVGMGESMPVADNGTSAGQHQNRRVVFRNSAGS